MDTCWRAKLAHISTRELVHDYLESYMDIARCELFLNQPDIPSKEYQEVHDRMTENRRIVPVVLRELVARGDTSLFDERTLILGRFSTK